MARKSKAPPRLAITVNVVRETLYGESYDEFMEWLNRHISTIPEEHRKSISIKTEDDHRYGDTYSYFVLSYERPETDSEYEKRTKADLDRLTAQEQREYETFLRLQKKFEK